MLLKVIRGCSRDLLLDTCRVFNSLNQSLANRNKDSTHISYVYIEFFFNFVEPIMLSQLLLT